MEYVSADHSDNISDLQTPLLITKESGQTKRCKWQWIVKQHLRNGVEDRLDYKLQKSICKTCHNTNVRAIPVTDQHNEQHAEQGDRASHGQICELNQRADHGKPHCRSRKYKLLRGDTVLLLLLMLTNDCRCNDQRQNHDDRNHDSYHGETHRTVSPRSLRGSK